ncbi:MAG TPA: MobF family relaxase [Solirubrobacteraceae bacterium]|jgi:conjugative relaxase-like TrwC/TraI family protein|nr:MobF family relaxase [Solirubrobacteraceae bacterium]
MTAASIGAAKGGGYARYLESKTVIPERGDYYLSPEGEPTQAPGRWLASADTLARLGLEGESVDGRDFIALMEGRHPRSGQWLRPAGAGGGRGGGIDLTFSAPKSVSAIWALGDPSQRKDMEAAHAAAVSDAIAHLTETVPTVRRSYENVVVEEQAVDLVAAEYRHTTARGVMEGDAPDPQLHSHVVVTSAIRDDGRLVAVASRPIFRAARELGAYYRSALAHELSQRGYAIERGTGKDGRYFEIAGVPRGLRDAFSARSREVARAAERFRAKWGRAPERGELRQLKLENREEKVLVTRSDLRQAWEETAARFDFTAEEPGLSRDRAGAVAVELPLEDRVERRLTERAATFEAGELRAVLLEQSVGELAPRHALAYVTTMVAERRILPLEGGRLTTLAVRAREQAIERRFGELSAAAGRDVGEHARAFAGERIAERIGARLSDEQAHALEVITGPERGAVLIGPAGTGKGVVIDAAARAEQLTGHHTFGIAVSGSTAQRLGQDSPALAGQTLTLDALVSRVNRGRLRVDEKTTIYFDEAGMADTDRLERLTEVVIDTGSKLVAIGDGAQLPSIGAGGMFDRLVQLAPSARLSNVLRTLDPAEQRAWADLRAGRSDRAMAHYLAKGRLHMADTRDEAVEHAVRNWARLTKTEPIEQVALISDASNQEIHRLNARAQHYRSERGELGELEVPVPGVHYGIREGDRVAMIDQHHEPGMERIENGERGEVLHITNTGEVLIEFDLTGRQRTLAGEGLASLRLGYASHIHRAQGATVTRTLVVTGGWQTSKEPAYVEASRARQGTDWYVARQDLGVEGHDTDRIDRLAEAMSHSHAQTPSLTYRELAEHEHGPHLTHTITPTRTPLPTIARILQRVARPEPEQERTR